MKCYSNDQCIYNDKNSDIVKKINKSKKQVQVIFRGFCLRGLKTNKKKQQPYCFYVQGQEESVKPCVRSQEKKEKKKGVREERYES